MNSAQTVLHLLKNDIRRQRWIFLSWVLLGILFIAVTPNIPWLRSITFGGPLNEVGKFTLKAIVGVVFYSGFYWGLIIAPPILGLNTLSADPVAGSDRFWMTRPVSGKVLFLEKSLLVLFIISFHSVLLYCFIGSSSNNKEFFGIYAILIPLFAILVAQLTILPRKFVSVLCVVAFVFPATQIFNSTILYRLELLLREPVQISLLPSFLALLIPFVFLGIGIANQYITRRTKRTLFFFAFSLLCVAGVSENSVVPLEFLEMKEAISCKGTIESSGKEFDCHYEIHYRKQQERNFPARIIHFNVPKSEVNCYWSPHATKNPNEQFFGDWIYQDGQFEPHILGVRAPIVSEFRFSNSISNGLLDILNEDLKNPSWRNLKKLMKERFSQKAVFVSGKKETKLPLQIFLKERKLTRVAEGPLKKDNFIVFTRDGRAAFKEPSPDELSIRFSNALDGEHGAGSGMISSNFLVILYNPQRNEAAGYENPLYANNYQLPEETKIFRAEWRKDAQIIVYHITDTGRAGRATLEIPAK
jgi:hypothetical protein